jgi:hypothetical protein
MGIPSWLIRHADAGWVGAGNAVTPPAARDLLWAVTESLSAA